MLQLAEIQVQLRRLEQAVQDEVVLDIPIVQLLVHVLNFFESRNTEVC